MHEFIKKNIKLARVFQVLILGQIAALIALGGFNNEDTAILVLTIPIFTIIYIGVYSQFLNNVKWLKKKGYENITDDIDISNPTLPKSKIYCGQRAFFSKKPKAIIPYSEIAWVYVKKSKINGISAENHTIIYMNDGKKFTITVHRYEEEFKLLLANYIIKNSPNVILGYGPEQKMKYKKINKNSKK